jgi:hypothetical protein
VHSLDENEMSQLREQTAIKKLSTDPAVHAA